jgi:hypothetical protein
MQQLIHVTGNANYWVKGHHDTQHNDIQHNGASYDTQD